MKSIFTILFTVLFFAQSGFAQKITEYGQLPTQRTCATSEPSQQWEDWLQEKIAIHKAQAPSQRNTLYTIPVVFHIIHNGESIGSQTNLSTAQVNSQLDVLNEDFRQLNSDNSNLPSVWTNLAADCEINFCAATVDPNGNTLAVPGINRINRSTAGFTSPPFSSGYMDNTIKPATIWDPNDYLNVWVANMSGGLLGYATWPPGSGLVGVPTSNQGTLTSDGVVILYNALGRTGNLIPQYNKGRTATHEIGHWLGLRHIWGDGACQTDYCADTPTQQSSNFGCPSWPSTSNCTGNSPNGDMFYNFMDYSDDLCLITFTEDQKTRVQTVMSNSTFRINLANSTACGPIAAAPNADFSANTVSIIQGNSVNFIDLSANVPTGWSWTFTGGSPGTSGAQNPLNITYNVPGCYAVTLVATNANGSDTETKTCYIDVLPIGTTLCDTVSNFLPANTPSLTGSGLWGYVSGHNDYNDISKADKFDAPPSGYNIDGLIIDIAVAHPGNASSSVDFTIWNESGGQPGTVAATANRLINTINTAVPTTMMFTTPVGMTGPYFAGLQFSPNGTPQDTIAIIHSANGQTVPNTAWEQWSDNSWHQFSEYPASWGMEIALAVYPILCTFTTGVDDVKDIHFDVYPNPANTYIILHTHDLNSKVVDVQITDMLGKTVYKEQFNNTSAINEKVDIQSYAKGTYVVTLVTDNSTITKKLVIE
ncbi:MAG: T9SS type A sorting domain-containing protein [Bacteroidia bacterium]|nr:T9SS type A sorting domain-containing protein [Bacteroidia bacterium]NNC85208.1 T9SS type A sorting domain-containing protein [Bacteroidia bacterium]NNM16168.1 T9SS type A sorting domain-containing protein [Bacteroidia bacterium]